jgi:hypothetical protein
VILVDTSIWVDHLRVGDAGLVGLLERSLVLGHPWVSGELRLGRIRQRAEVLGGLAGMPQATVATPDEVARLIERHQLVGLGIGYVDAQLLAATKLTPDARLWSRDKRLVSSAERVGCTAPGLD